MLPLLLPVAVALALTSPDQPGTPILEAVDACGAREPTVLPADDGHSLLIHVDLNETGVQSLIFCLVDELEMPNWLAYQIVLTPPDVTSWNSAAAAGYTATWIDGHIIIYDDTTLAPAAGDT